MKRRRKTPLDHPELDLPEVRTLWQTEGLFSDHYLKSRIQHNDWWPSDDSVCPLWQFCVDLFTRRYVPCAQNNEAFTRQELLNPILAKLGFAWTDNLSLPDQDAEPDYILFADAADKEAVITQSRDKRYRAATALLEAKKVNHPLSKISKHQQRYPHQQVRDYLQEAQVLGWGILTNGNEWRLYCHDTKPSHFFSLNFAVAIQSLDNFKYFLALFSPAAFVRDSAGKCRLDAIRDSALAAQTELEADLRQRMFTLVEILANGFAERTDNAIPDNPEGHRLLYENCLIFLYRLLFILYAEGRLLLPVEPKSRKYYKDLSLARLVHPLKGFTDFDSQTRTRLCEDIGELCHIINGTDEAKNKEYSVPRYNGGLFDPDRYPHLERWRICDAKLAEVLRGLMFAKPDRHNRELPLETVDYADLRVQQLGSIYEGLLEHRFARNAAGRLELQTDKAERKATGAYYTPDYIVNYIVEHTIGPLVADMEQRPEVKQGKDNSFADAVLALNICDPAMGSGHFLVEATTWLADHIVYHPTTRFQAEFQRGESQEQMEISYWRRRVVEACIYGVDLNPLAVELAKLSLWLITIAGDRPLNFLDHHLRCGNSLIGARLDQLAHVPSRKGRAPLLEAPQQVEFTFGPDFKKAAASAIRQIHQIEGVASATVANVKDKERLWGEISKSLAPYKTVADLWTSTFFGQPLDEETYIATAQKILAGQKVGNDLASSRRFFHWELEFPEVFFNEDGSHKENPGFDVVIGNPPYGDILNEVEKECLVSRGFQAGGSGNNDVFRFFVEQAILLSAPKRWVSFIIPNTCLSGAKYRNYRKRISFMATANSILDFKTFKVFRADVFTHIPVFSTNRLAEAYVCPYVAAPDGKWRDKSAGGVSITSGSEEGWLPTGAIYSRLAVSKHICKLIEIADSADVGINYQRHGVGWQARQESDVAERVFYEGKRQHTDDIQYLKGEDIGRFVVSPTAKRWLRHDYASYVGEGESISVNHKWAVKQPKILTRQTGDSIIAALDEDCFYTGRSLHSTVLKDSTCSCGYVCAVLNSRLITHIYRALSHEEGRAQAQVKLANVRRLPVVRIALTTPAVERKRMAKKGQELYESAVKQNDTTGVLKFAEQQRASDHSDVVHDLLAFLAERMMELNRDKQAAARGFLTDMRDFHGIDAHALTPKTRLDKFWRLETADVFAHLQANRKRLAAQNVHLTEAAENKLRKRFESAQKNIIPLEPIIAFTDALIDQLVYRLYGLTNEEIRMVEEAGD